MAGWDEDEFEADIPAPSFTKGGWEDEDEEEPEEAWDAESEPEEKEEDKKTDKKPDPAKGKGKGKGKGEKGQSKELTPEEIKRQEEEAEAAVLRDVFSGAVITDQDRNTSLATLVNPKDEVDAAKFASVVSDRLLSVQIQSKPLFMVMMKELLTLCTNPLSSDEVKELNVKLNVIQTEKIKSARNTGKGGKKKDKKKTPTVNMGRHSALDGYEDFDMADGDAYDEFEEDFM